MQYLLDQFPSYKFIITVSDENEILGENEVGLGKDLK